MFQITYNAYKGILDNKWYPRTSLTKLISWIERRYQDRIFNLISTWSN